ncbi:MAG: 4-phosphoerythronate dehydrogenase [Bacteroidales bacterium]|nr:4-phosphoerythronate dehydrogenase [Bacteroidales bacterium]
MLKIIADAGIPFLQGVLEPFGSIEYLPSSAITNDSVKDADAILIRTRTTCNSQLLENSKVKYIGTATIGFDHIDQAYCLGRGIAWTNAAGCNADSVCQYVINSLIFLENQHNSQLSGKTLGIVGLGNVGSRVKAAMELLGLKVLVNDPPRAMTEGNAAYVTLENLLAQSDIVSLHVPLNKDGQYKTHHLISKQELSKFKKGAILINTSRGEVVSNPELLEALKQEAISNTILDVWENEPYPNNELLNLSAISTPHIAGYSLDGKANATSILVQNLSRHFNIPLSDWRADLSQHQSPLITIEGKGKLPEQIAKEALTLTYDILSDDRPLRANPDFFEQLRFNYPLRRDIQAYTVQITNGSIEQAVMLEKLGFKKVIFD